MQAGCQPPGRVCQAVISVRTRTLGPTRCELVRSALLIASPTAPAWGNTASQAPLHEVTGMAALGFSHPSWHKCPLRWHLCLLMGSASPMAVPGSPAGVLAALTPHQTSLARSRPRMLACDTAIAGGRLALRSTAPTLLPTRNVGTAAPLTSWGRAGGTLGFAIHTGTPAPSPAVGQGAGGPVYATQARSVAQNAGTPAALPRPGRTGRRAAERRRGRGGRRPPPAGAAPREGAWRGGQVSQWEAAAVNINEGRANRGAAMLLTA